MKQFPCLLTAVVGFATLFSAGYAAAQDELYITQPNESTITVQNTSGGTPTTLPTSPDVTDPTGIAYYNGLVYIADSNSGDISTYNPSNGQFGVYYTNTGLVTNAQGIAFDSNGNLYVANGTGNDIIRISGGTASVYASTNLTDPTSLALVGNTIYATETSANAIAQVFSLGSTGFVNGFYPTSTYPANPTITGAYGIAVDSFGNGDFAVAGKGSNTIYTVTASAKGSVSITAMLNKPEGIAFDPNNDGSSLFVADNGTNEVTEYVRGGPENGFTFGTAFPGITDPDFLAFAPGPNGPAVPEPGTYLMLFGGLVALYVYQRRRTLATIRP